MCNVELNGQRSQCSRLVNSYMYKHCPSWWLVHSPFKHALGLWFAMHVAFYTHFFCSLVWFQARCWVCWIAAFYTHFFWNLVWFRASRWVRWTAVFYIHFFCNLVLSPVLDSLDYVFFFLRVSIYFALDYVLFCNFRNFMSVKRLYMEISCFRITCVLHSTWWM